MKIMKNKRVIRIVAVALLAVMMALSLASCAAGGKTTVKDTSGDGWTLTDGTLLIKTDCKTEDVEKASDIAWSKVTVGVKKLVVENGVTRLPNYACYAMTALESVDLPASLTEIGDYAFAFTGALKTVSLPANLTKIGKGAFEASGLDSLKLPAGVTAINERCFVYCDDLEWVSGEGVETVGAEAFAYCKSFKTLSVKNVDGVKAAVGTIIEKDGAVPTVNLATTNTFTVTVNYVFEDGKEAAPTHSGLYAPGEHSVNSPAVDGYTADKTTVSFTVVDANLEPITVKYTKNPEETQPPVESETAPVDEPKNDKMDAWTWVALIGTVVILIGVAVAVILYVRHDKKKTPAKGQKKNKK